MTKYTDNVIKMVLVANNRPDMFRSLCSSVGAKYAVNYAVGMVTKPTLQHSALFAFDTLLSGMNFIDKTIWENQRVYALECEYKAYGKELPAVCRLSVIQDNAVFEQFWHRVFTLEKVKTKDWWQEGQYGFSNSAMIAGYTDYMTYNYVPDGTVACKWIKPVEIVGFVKRGHFVPSVDGRLPEMPGRLYE